MKKYTSAVFFCADRIDVITNFDVITNIIIKRVHCTCILILSVVLLYYC